MDPTSIPHHNDNTASYPHSYPPIGYSYVPDYRQPLDTFAEELPCYFDGFTPRGGIPLPTIPAPSYFHQGSLTWVPCESPPALLAAAGAYWNSNTLSWVSRFSVQGFPQPFIPHQSAEKASRPSTVNSFVHHYSHPGVLCHTEKVQAWLDRKLGPMPKPFVLDTSNAVLEVDSRLSGWSMARKSRSKRSKAKKAKAKSPRVWNKTTGQAVQGESASAPALSEPASSEVTTAEQAAEQLTSAEPTAIPSVAESSAGGIPQIVPETKETPAAEAPRAGSPAIGILISGLSTPEASTTEEKLAGTLATLADLIESVKIRRAISLDTHPMVIYHEPWRISQHSASRTTPGLHHALAVGVLDSERMGMVLSKLKPMELLPVRNFYRSMFDRDLLEDMMDNKFGLVVRQDPANDIRPVTGAVAGARLDLDRNRAVTILEAVGNPFTEQREAAP